MINLINHLSPLIPAAPELYIHLYFFRRYLRYDFCAIVRALLIYAASPHTKFVIMPLT